MAYIEGELGTNHVEIIGAIGILVRLITFIKSAA